MTGGEIAQIITALTGVAGLLVSMHNARAIREVKAAANGLSTALATAAELKGRAEGKEQERREERERTDPEEERQRENRERARLLRADPHDEG